MKEGSIFQSNSCGKVKVLKYVNSLKVLVKFLNTGYVKYVRKGCILDGVIKNPFNPSNCGKGYIGVGDYTTTKTGIHNKIYKCWSHMMERCYSENFHSKENYKGRSVKVCTEWLCYQEFARWYESKYIDGWCLDKDITKSKVYSPETCCFLPVELNMFFTTRRHYRNGLPIGVYEHCNRYVACCSDGGKTERMELGRFTCPYEAFKAYKVYKENRLSVLIDKYRDKLPERTIKLLEDYEFEPFPD